MDEEEELKLGQDVVLREKETLNDLLAALPQKAQLGFSGLKEKFYQRNDAVLKEVQKNEKQNGPLRLEYTCINATEKILVIGCNLGIIFIYNRILKAITKFTCENKQMPVVSIQIQESKSFIATGQFSGTITIFKYADAKNGLVKAVLKCTVDSHHKSPVTCIQWTPDSTKLFTADSDGNVAITVINMDEGKTHTVFICKEDSPITQLSFSHTALLISTLKRSLIWPFNTKKIVQVGMQERKVFGNFGACFYPPPCDRPSDVALDVFAARPGLRLWKATSEGKVISTMMFKDSVYKGEPIIETIDLASQVEIKNKSDQKQFGPLKVFFEKFIVTWKGSCIWVIDPLTGVIIGAHDNLGYVVDVSVYENELFILTKSQNSLVRKISFETITPCIVVEEIDLNEPEQIIKAQIGSSIRQFKDQDQIDKLIDGVGMKLKDTLKDVKSRVKEFKDQIISNSEDDRVSDAEKSILNSDLTSDDNCATSTDYEKSELSPGPFESSNDELQYSPDGSPGKLTDANNIDKSPKVFDHLSKEEFPQDIALPLKSKKRKKKRKQDDNEDDGDTTTLKGFDGCEIKQNTSGASLSDEYTTSYSSDQIDNTNGKNGLEYNGNQINDSNFNEFNTSHTNSSLDALANTITYTNGTITYSGNEIIRNEKEIGIDSVDNADNKTPIAVESNSPEFYFTMDEQTNDKHELLNDKIPESLHSPTNVLIDSPIVSDDNVDIPHIENAAPHTNELNQNITDELLVTRDNDNNIAQQEGTDREDVVKVAVDVNKTDTLNALVSQSQSSGETTPSGQGNITKRNKESTSSTEEYKKNGHEKLSKKMSENTDTLPIINSKHMNTVRDSDSSVVHVKISHQRQGSNASVQSLGISERCKQIRGEAFESVSQHRRQPSAVSVGMEDTIEANIVDNSSDEQIMSSLNVKIEIENEDLDGKLYPISPFPAPQVNCIYSQRSISLSECSFSQFESDATEGDMVETTEIYDYDKIDVNTDLIASIESMTDIEDNAIEESGESLSGERVQKSKHRSSLSGDPFDEGRLFFPTKTKEEAVQERLRYLADSWADVKTPNGIIVQHVACSGNLIWIVDSNNHFLYSSSTSQNYNWKKCDGRGTHIATNQVGTVVWSIDRNNTCHVRTGVKESCPQGTHWESLEKDMLHISVDNDSVWAIKTNGDVFVRTGVSSQTPRGTGWIKIKASSDLVQITSLSGLVWALDIYNHVQIFQGELEQDSTDVDLFSTWVELPGITATDVVLGAKSVCWIIDSDNGVWFNQDISKENPLGGTWYELSLGEHQDATWFSSILSYFTKGNKPKMIVSNEIAGTFILGKQGLLHVAHGHLLGTRWELTVPPTVSNLSCWSCVAAGGSDMNNGYIWLLQPNGQLLCFKSNGADVCNVHPPSNVVLKYCSAGPRSLWVLTSNQDVFIRQGISEACPKGLKWLKIDISTEKNKKNKIRLKHLCSGNLVLWGVDFEGNVWFQKGRDDRRGKEFNPPWVLVEGCPLDSSKFTKIVVGPDDHIVWVCDDKNNIYARKGVTDSLGVGTSWEVVEGSSGKDLAISYNHVWALCPNGDLICRYGVSKNNVVGDYWRKVPGTFELISVSANDDLWGIDRQGHLYERQTLLFYGSSLSSRAPSYNDLFSDHNDWELI